MSSTDDTVERAVKGLLKATASPISLADPRSSMSGVIVAHAINMSHFRFDFASEEAGEGTR